MSLLEALKDLVLFICSPVSYTVMRPARGAPAVLSQIVMTEICKCRIFSIDPPTARDLDDALSIEALPGGTFRVGVHIADVAHFVPAGSALDMEARERGTSVYLVDRIIPMLPRLLCEQLCSLNPGVTLSSRTSS